jgi:hypothetical protein
MALSIFLISPIRRSTVRQLPFSQALPNSRSSRRARLNKKSASPATNLPNKTRNVMHKGKQKLRVVKRKMPQPNSNNNLSSSISNRLKARAGITAGRASIRDHRGPDHRTTGHRDTGPPLNQFHPCTRYLHLCQMHRVDLAEHPRPGSDIMTTDKAGELPTFQFSPGMTITATDPD